MKINELVEFVNSNEIMRDEQMHAALLKKLEVKEYIGIDDKRNIVNDIINHCIIFENGVFKFDEIDKYLWFTMKAIEAYTNLEISNDVKSDYDELCRTGLLNKVIGLFKAEYEDLNIILSMECDYILVDNSIEAQVGKFLDEVLGQVDKVVDAVKHTIDSLEIDKSVLENINIDNVTQFLNNLSQ